MSTIRIAGFTATGTTLLDGMVQKTGVLFECGEYESHDFSLTEEEADQFLGDVDLPGNYEHTEGGALPSGAWGKVVKLWRDGKKIMAEFRIPKWLDEAFAGGPIKVSAEMHKETKRPVGWAVVGNPRIDGAAMFAAFSAGALDARATVQQGIAVLTLPNGESLGSFTLQRPAASSAKETKMSMQERVAAFKAKWFGKPLDDEAVAEFEKIAQDSPRSVIEGATANVILPDQTAKFADMVKSAIAEATAPLQQKIDGLQSELAATKVATFSEKAAAEVDGLVAKFHINRAVGEKLKALAAENPAAYAAAVAMFKENGPTVTVKPHQLIELGAGGAGDATAKFTGLLKERMEKTGEDVKVATRAVFSANPELEAEIMAGREA